MCASATSGRSLPMPERSVSLDLHLGLRDSARMPLGDTGSDGTREEPLDPLLAGRFAAALAATASNAEAAERPGPGVTIGSPFELLTSLRSVDTHDDAPTDRALDDVAPVPGDLLMSSARPSSLLDSVAELADRILVDVGDQGRREVRIEVSEDVLPGVSLSVYQQHGEWIAAFRCTDPAAYTLLAEPAEQMARDLADLLQAPARWCVTFDSTPPAQTEAFAQPTGHPSR